MEQRPSSQRAKVADIEIAIGRAGQAAGVDEESVPRHDRLVPRDGIYLNDADPA